MIIIDVYMIYINMYTKMKIKFMKGANTTF